MEPLSKYDAIVDIGATKANLCFMPCDYLPGGHWFGSGPSALLIVPAYRDEKNKLEARQLQRLARDL